MSHLLKEQFLSSLSFFSPLHFFLFVLQLRNVKETHQHTEEEVGAFTKLIEAMGFTGPLKYNKWVSAEETGETWAEKEQVMVIKFSAFHTLTTFHSKATRSRPLNAPSDECAPP